MDPQTPRVTQISPQNQPQDPSFSEPAEKAKFTPLIILFGILGMIMLFGIGGYFGLQTKKPKIKACTEEAKICPDGTTVARIAPNCEFAPCPITTPDQPSSPSSFLTPTGGIPTTQFPTIRTSSSEKQMEQSASIEGEITLNYNIPEFPNVEDDIYVLISEKNEKESNYFSAGMCEKNGENCVWKVSESGKKRIYAYKATLEGGTDILRAGERYKVYISIRHFNTKGNITATESPKVSVEIPISGRKTQNFDLAVNPLE